MAKPNGRSSGNKPDFKIWAAQGEHGQGTVGVAWKGDDGEINLKLNPFVVLDTRGSEKLVLKLYPIEDEQQSIPF